MHILGYVFVSGHPIGTLMWFWMSILCLNKNIALAFEVTIIVTGWLYIVSFSKLFKLTGFFTVMFARLVSKDLPRFLIITVVAIIAFGSAIYATYAKMDMDRRPTGLRTIMITFVSLFRLALSLADLSFASDPNNLKLIRLCIYIMYLITCNIVLLHMLIAALTDTYSTISKHGSSVWRRSQARDILMLELSLPNWLQLKFIRNNLKMIITEELCNKGLIIQKKSYGYQLLETLKKQKIS